MRVTDRQLFENAAREAQSARSRLEAARRETSTGLRVEHPEDDPGAASLIAVTRPQADRERAITRAMGTAFDELGSADAALSGVGDALSRARELAVQLSNATYSANERAGAAKEVEGLLATVIGLMNTKAGHRYIFGGFKDDTPPFTQTGAYAGDTGVRQVEVAPGVLVDASVRADVAVSGVGGGVDVMALLQTLSTALSSNNVAQIQGTLDGLDTGIEQIAFARATVGSSQAVLDAGTSAAMTAGLAAETRLSNLADADLLGASARLAQAERALEASLTASARSFRLSLLDKL
jgi:flagellar hook-associated protein 3 FlgL